MDRNDIELIVLSVSSGKEQAIFMKVYQDGTLIRHGAGGLPGVHTSAYSPETDREVFQKLIVQVPAEAVRESMHLKAEDAQGDALLEYSVGFYGKSENGEHGERAKWGQNVGIRLVFDPAKPVESPLLPYLDGLVSLAASLTNSWYFDVMVEASLDMKSEHFPPDTMTSLYPEAEEVRKDFGNYLSQIRQSPQGWKLEDLAAGKRYFNKAGQAFSLSFSEDEGKFHYQFTPVS